MEIQQKFCPKCGAEIRDPETDKCLSCEKKSKKALYKKWWFWLMIGLCMLALGGAMFIDDGRFFDEISGIREDVSQEGDLCYEVVDLQVLFDDLDANALRAKEQYQDKYVQFEGEIALFDGEGVYICVKAKNAEIWDSSSVLCYTTDKEQKDLLMRMSPGDSVTIRGRITQIGKIRGYSLKIYEIE